MRPLLFLILSLATWASAVGGFQLHPENSYLQFAFPVETPPWSFDPAFYSALVAGLAQVTSLALLLFGWPGSALGASLAATCWWASAAHGWLLAASPPQALAHLLLSAALVAHWRGYWPVAVVLALPVITLQPPLIWLLIAAWPLETLLGGSRRAAAGAAVLALIALFAGAWPAPEFAWVGWFWLLPLAWMLNSQAARPWLALEFGCQLAGQPGLGAAAAVGAAAGEFMAERWNSDWRLGCNWDGEKLELDLSHKALIAAFVALLLYCGALPGEAAFNRELLLTAQAKKIELSRLLKPLPLRQWCLEHGLNTQDLELAQELAGLPGSVVVLTPGQHRESALQHAMLAALSGRQLAGWRAGELLPGAQLARLLSKPELAGSDHVRLRGNFPSRLVVEHLELIDRQATSYQVLRNGQPWGPPVTYQQGPSFFRLPVTPGNYEVQGQSWKVTPPKLMARWLEPSKQPSRSLVKLQLELGNLSDGYFDLSRVRAVTLTSDNPSFSPPRQPWQGLGLLAPMTSTELSLWLATPEPEGTYRLRLTLHADQGDIVVPLAQPLRCWRRLPPVGTWVEP